MATTTRTEPAPLKETYPFPALQNGDRLNSDEFLKRYEAMPHLKKAELIEGVVYIPTSFSFGPPRWTPEMASPVWFRQHSSPHFDLITWLGLYRMSTPGVVGGDNGSIRIDDANMPQPDAFLMIEPERGGQAGVTSDDFVSGAPELIAEVAASSAGYDLHDKLRVYERNGVSEYVVWSIFEQAITWFVLRGERFEPLKPADDGVLRSGIFPGLWLDPAALIRGDLATVAQIAQRGVASPEHAQFLERLSHKHEGPAAR